MRSIVHPDARNRISFARVVPDMKPGDRYIVERQPDGVIVLTPVKAVDARALAAR